MGFFEYLGRNYDLVLIELLNHIKIIAIAIPIAIGIGVPIGIVVSRSKRASSVALYGAGILMTIPSLALFGYMVVLLAPLKAGIGVTPAVIALVIYSFLPVIRNTVVAVNSVDPRMIEAARGMGMTNWQILFRVRLPLTIPIIMAGVRNAAVMGVSVATIAYLIGARGLGYFIFSGLGRSNFNMVLLGALIVSILGIGTNYGLLALEEIITPRGLKIEREK
jgi:osmoprotectant transport system permease protein